MNFPLTLVFSETEITNIDSICSDCNVVSYKLANRLIKGHVFFNRLNCVVEQYEKIQTNYYYEINDIDNNKFLMLKIALGNAVVLKIKSTEDELLVDKLFETYSLKEFADDGLVTASEMMQNMVEEIGEYLSEATKDEIEDYVGEVKKLENKLDNFKNTIQDIYEKKLKV